MKERINTYKTLIGISEGKEIFGRPKRRQENNIKIGSRDNVGDDSIHVSQDRIQYRALMNTAMNHRIP